jgi:hypothetical protein
MTLDLMVDIDEVLCPTIDTIHQIAFEAGHHDNSEPIRMWKGFEQYGIPQEVYWDLWSDFALGGGYVKTPPIEGSLEALRWLMWEGHRIHLVTARGFMSHADEIRAWTPMWLEEWAVPHHTLTFAQDKVQAMHDLGVVFDSALDDSPSNFAKLDAAGINVYLQNHPHNEDADIPAERRVPNLWEWAYRLEKSLVTA